MVRRPRSGAAVLWPSVQIGAPDECWPRLTGIGFKGYSQVKIGGRDGTMYYAHRVAFALSRGLDLDSLDGVDICHTCDNRPCCNPAHLFAGDQWANTHDMMDKGRGWWQTAEGMAAARERGRTLRIRGTLAMRHERDST